MGLMVLFGDLLSALRNKGKNETAAHYEKLVADKFEGTLSKQQIEQLDVDQIVAVLKTVELLQLPKLSPLQEYVQDLQRRGFTVTVGEKYRVG